MNRHEQILDKAYWYADASVEIGENTEFVRNAFAEGAKWADDSRWISVEDRLPSSGQYVFMWDKYEGRDIGFYNGSMWINKESGIAQRYVSHFCEFPCFSDYLNNKP